MDAKRCERKVFSGGQCAREDGHDGEHTVHGSMRAKGRAMAVEAHAKAVKEVRDALAGLSVAIETCPSMSVTAPHWGHVGDLAHFRDMLVELTATVRS